MSKLTKQEKEKIMSHYEQTHEPVSQKEFDQILRDCGDDYKPETIEYWKNQKNKVFIYIHGFLSNGLEKLTLLKMIFGNVIDVNIDHSQPKQTLLNIHRIFIEHISKEFVFIGNSLGGFFAYHLASVYDQKAILFNPSLEPFNNIKIGKYKNYHNNKFTEITQQTLNEWEEIYYKTNLCEKLYSAYLCYVGINDKTVDPNISKRHFKKNRIELNCEHKIDNETFVKCLESQLVTDLINFDISELSLPTC